jgi:hypothetical protein
MQDKLDQLFERLNENLAEFRAKWAAMSSDALIDNSREITAIKDAHYYLTESHGFEPEEANYLLLFQNPLQVVADKWLERTEDLSDFSFALNEVFDKQDALRDYDLKEKPSVLEKLRSAASSAVKPGHPSREQEVR